MVLPLISMYLMRAENWDKGQHRLGRTLTRKSSGLTSLLTHYYYWTGRSYKDYECESVCVFLDYKCDYSIFLISL